MPRSVRITSGYVGNRTDAPLAGSASWQSTQVRAETLEPTVQTPTPFDKPLEESNGLVFAQMTRGQKYVFVAKLVACIATFGYAFPNVQND